MRSEAELAASRRELELCAGARRDRRLNQIDISLVVADDRIQDLNWGSSGRQLKRLRGDVGCQRFAGRLEFGNRR